MKRIEVTASDMCPQPTGWCDEQGVAQVAQSSFQPHHRSSLTCKQIKACLLIALILIPALLFPAFGVLAGMVGTAYAARSLKPRGRQFSGQITTWALAAGPPLVQAHLAAAHPVAKALNTESEGEEHALQPAEKMSLVSAKSTPPSLVTALQFFAHLGMFQSPSGSCAFDSHVDTRVITQCASYSKELNDWIEKTRRYDLLALARSSNERFFRYKEIKICIHPDLEHSMRWREALRYLDEEPLWERGDCLMGVVNTMRKVHAILMGGGFFHPYRTYDVADWEMKGLKKRLFAAFPEEARPLVDQIIGKLKRHPETGHWTFGPLSTEEQTLLKESKLLPPPAVTIPRHITTLSTNLCSALSRSEDLKESASHLLYLLLRLKPWPEHTEGVARAMANSLLKQGNFSLFLPIDLPAYRNVTKSYEETARYMRSCEEQWPLIRRVLPVPEDALPET